VVGLSPPQANAVLAGNGFSGSGSCSPGGSAPSPGVVTSQDPTAGYPASPGAVVSYTYTIAPTFTNPQPCS
jgi:hypothetical protein